MEKRDLLADGWFDVQSARPPEDPVDGRPSPARFQRGFEGLNLITRRWKRHNLLIFRRQNSRLRAFCAPIEDSACEKVKIQDLTPFVFAG